MLKSLVSSTQCEVGAGAYQQDLRAIRKACVDFLVLASRKVATAGRKTSFVGSHSLSLSLSLSHSLSPWCALLEHKRRGNDGSAEQVKEVLMAEEEGRKKKKLLLLCFSLSPSSLHACVPFQVPHSFVWHMKRDLREVY